MIIVLPCEYDKLIKFVQNEWGPQLFMKNAKIYRYIGKHKIK